MEVPIEQIEVSFDAQVDQITIVVGNESNSVQSVVVLSSNFTKKRLLWNRVQSASKYSRRPSSHLNNTGSSRAPPTRKDSMRSELLRPDSPPAQRQRSSAFDGRRGERDQPPGGRGRESLRSDRSVGSHHSHQRQNGRQPSLRGISKESRFHRRMDRSSSYIKDMPPTEKCKANNKKSNKKRTTVKSFRPKFRNNRVDPIVLVADV